MEAKTWYRHTPLPGPRWTRILALEPGQETDRLKCRVELMNMDERQPYMALSYVWGSDYHASPIHLSDDQNEGSFNVTSSLYSFLTYIRANWDTLALPHNAELTPVHDPFQKIQQLHKELDVRLQESTKGFTGKELYVWADAICINQFDSKEKSAHIRLMKDIYEQSTRILGWLGPAEPGCDLAIKILRQAQADLSLGLYISKIRASIDTPALSWMNFWTSLKILGNLPYWKRVWIQQECSLRVHTSFILGNELFNRFMLHFGYEILLANFYKETIQSMGSINRAFLTLEQDNYSQKSTPSLFLRLVADKRTCQATDPRDRIYALMGFLDNMDSFPVDYKLPISQVFQDFAIYHIRASNTLDVLGYSGYAGKIGLLPSWIPDWNNHIMMMTPLPKWHQNTGQLAYRGMVELQKKFKTTPSTEGPVLKLEGICVGHVKSKVSPKFYIRAGRLQRLVIPDLAFAETYPFTGETLGEVYLRTLTADMAAKNYCPIRKGRKFSPSIANLSSKSTPTFVLRALLRPYPEDTFTSTDIINVLNNVTTRRNWITLDNGYVGLGPHNVMEGDSVWILRGGQVLYVLRKLEADPKSPQADAEQVLIGEIYVHGLMDGEALTNIENGSWKIEPNRIR